MNQELSTDVLYTIPTTWDEELPIKHTANGWWLNKEKVFYMMAVFKMGGTIVDACSFVGISIDQYKYFVTLHPQFTEIRKRLKAFPMIRALNTLYTKGFDNLPTCRWWLERNHPDFMSVSKFEQYIKYHTEEELNNSWGLTKEGKKSLHDF